MTIAVIVFRTEKPADEVRTVRVVVADVPDLHSLVAVGQKPTPVRAEPGLPNDIRTLDRFTHRRTGGSIPNPSCSIKAGC